MEGNMSDFWGEFTDDYVVRATEIGSTVAATAGFILTASGVIGVGSLFPFFLICAVGMTVMKGMHVVGLHERKKGKQKEEQKRDKKIMDAVQNKEIFTGAAFGTTMVVASVLTTHPAVYATLSAASGLLYPAQGLIALGFAIEALVEFYDNLCQWQELRAWEAKADPKIQEYEKEGYRQPSAATLKLALSSLLKFLGWSCVMTGSFAFALPLTTLWIAGGFGLVAISHFYNNFFATPRIKKERNDWLMPVDHNNSRMGKGDHGIPCLMRASQVI
jgi:hypothetical protein